MTSAKGVRGGRCKSLLNRALSTRGVVASQWAVVCGTGIRGQVLVLCLPRRGVSARDRIAPLLPAFPLPVPLCPGVFCGGMRFVGERGRSPYAILRCPRSVLRLLSSVPRALDRRRILRERSFAPAVGLPGRFLRNPAFSASTDGRQEASYYGGIIVSDYRL